MSYARFFDSDVYVFESDDGFVCMACELAPLVNTRFKGIQMHGDVIVQTRQEMVEHLKIHGSRGHDVGEAINRLEQEIAQETK